MTTLHVVGLLDPALRKATFRPPRRTVEQVGVPKDALVNSALPAIDWSDAYRIRLPRNIPTDPQYWRGQLFGNGNRRRISLLGIRDVVASGIGLKGARPGTGTSGAFPITATTDKEVVVGIDDAHLDFRASIIVERDEVGYSLVIATVVQRHNRLGHNYFRLIEPFHQRIVPAMLRRTVDRVVENYIEFW